MNFIVNPFFIYFISFLVVLISYQLNWSYLYPEINFDLYFFIFSTILFSFVLGVIYHCVFNKTINSPKEMCFFKKTSTSSIIIKSFIVLLFYCIEFFYEKSIPLISMMLGVSKPGDYLEFGIPSIHVLIVAFSHFLLSVHLNKMYKEKNRKHLILIFSVLFCDVLSLSRGLFMFSIMIWGFVKFFYLRKLKFKNIAFLFCFFIAFSYVFGLVGQYRSAYGDPVYAEKILGASSEFQRSSVPAPFLWVYIYTTSPFANLQEAINRNNKYLSDFPTFFIRCLTHQVVSKRIIDFDKEEFPLIAKNLTVGTIYYYSYNYFGYFGLVITYIYLVFIVFSFSLIAKGSVYFVPMSAMLNALVFLSVFDNMFITGFSLALFLSFFILLFRCFVRLLK